MVDSALHMYMETVLLPGDVDQRLHYLSVPPKAALSAIRTIAEAGLVERSRVVMEKPFGTDFASAVELNASCTRSSTRSRSSGSTTSSARSRRRTSSPSASPTGCSSRSGTATTSRTSRSTCPRRWASRPRARLLREHRRLPRHGRDPPLPDPRVHRDGAADRARAGCHQPGEEQGLPLDAADRAARRRARPVHRLPRRAGRRRRTPTPRPSSRSSATSTTGAGPACRSTCAPASGWPRGPGSSRSPSRSRRSRCSRRGPASATTGPTTSPSTSPTSRGCRCRSTASGPGPGMKLDKLSMQFAMQETHWAGAVLEAYERLIYDAVRGDHTLFTSAEGIERLWEISQPLLEQPAGRAALRAGHVGPEPDPPARRAAHLAAAVRAALAREELTGPTVRTREPRGRDPRGVVPPEGVTASGIHPAAGAVPAHTRPGGAPGSAGRRRAAVRRCAR